MKNYSPGVQKALKSYKIGQRIIVKKGKNSYEGMIMPRIELGDNSCIILKLDSGYNIGIRYEKGVSVKKSNKPEPAVVKEEAKFEMRGAKMEKIEYDKTKPKVIFIATGGTIASRVDYKTGGVSALEKPEELLMNVPELKNIVNITKTLKPFNKMSEDMDYNDWLVLAKLIAKESKHADGVIITHGTDTLHYTAAALSFMLKDIGKPIVLVGAQRSGDRGSFDGALNLICAAHVAASDIAEVGICMHGSTNDTYCNFIRGTKARKMHATRRDAFRSINENPIAKIYPDGRIEKTGEYNKRNDSEIKCIDKFEPKVALIKIFPGSDPSILSYYVKKGYKGFVLEGTGMGHVPTNGKNSWIPAIKKISKKIPVVIATQTLYGRVKTDVYSNLRTLYHEAGAIGAEDMLPETAYVKLGWILAQTRVVEKVKEMIQMNYAGEITKRTELETFMV